MTKKSIESIERKASQWLRQGISPQRLALTLALGFTVGCIPVVGIPTVLCLALALVFRLNLPALQAANYAMMPLQWLLMAPFVHLGARLFGSVRGAEARLMPHTPPMALVAQMGGMAGQALLAWLLIAIPAVALMTATLTVLLRRVPALAEAED